MEYFINSAMDGSPITLRDLVAKNTFFFFTVLFCTAMSMTPASHPSFRSIPVGLGR